MKYAGFTDIGLVRSENEDAYLASENILAVADGMGGHDAGGLASRTAIEIVSKAVGRRSARPQAALLEVFARANEAVLQKARERGHDGMGTTLTVVRLDGARAWVGHIGDSRLYRLRDGELRQLTRDHTLVADLMRSGQLSADKAKKHPRRNIITKAVGGQSSIKPDIFSFDLKPGDRLALCTDGLSSYVDADVISRLAAGGDPETACGRLIAAANSGGGLDNVTVVVADIEAESERWWRTALRSLARLRHMAGRK